MGYPKLGLKYDNGKPSIGLIPNKALVQIADVFDFGAKKYGRHNYREGLQFSRLIDAAYRHLGAFNDGEDLDPESGKSHIAHLGCCVTMLLTFMKEHPELDDRYKPNNEQK